MAWDVLSGAAKIAWDILSGVTKTAWVVCPGWQIDAGCFVRGGKKWHGMFCPTFESVSDQVKHSDCYKKKIFERHIFCYKRNILKGHIFIHAYK